MVSPKDTDPRDQTGKFRIALEELERQQDALADQARDTAERVQRAVRRLESTIPPPPAPEADPEPEPG